MKNAFIKELSINNYKCFDNKNIIFNVPDGENEGSGLNILIGENGNGKTAILEAMNYLTQNTYSSENKLKINDFHDYNKEILITGKTKTFNCKSSIDFYRDYHFQSNGFIFCAKSRESKARGKILSSPFEIHNYFQLIGKYIKQDGSEGRDVDSRDKTFNNSNIDDDEINIFYFDKNRTRQITTGNYKTTFEKICDDLNWKFVKSINHANDESVKKITDSICGDYFENVINIVQSGAGSKIASELKDFFDKEEYMDLKVELMDLLHPFSNAFFATRKEGELKQIDAKELGSGVEIILTLLLLKNIANESKGSIVYLIDEPEMHLHPRAMEKLSELLIKESKDKQIVVSTHSPYLFKNCLSKNVGLHLFKKNEDDRIEIYNAKESGWGIFPWSPSWGEINYYAYNLPTIEFHNELYGYLQEISEKQDVGEFDKYLKDDEKVLNTKVYKRSGKEKEQEITLCTYIRNQIHHPENKDNTIYTEKELIESIDILTAIIKSKRVALEAKK